MVPYLLALSGMAGVCLDHSVIVVRDLSPVGDCAQVL